MITINDLHEGVELAGFNRVTLMHIQQCAEHMLMWVFYAATYAEYLKQEEITEISIFKIMEHTGLGIDKAEKLFNEFMETLNKNIVNSQLN